METEDRPTYAGVGLIERIEAEPYLYDFFEAIRWIEATSPDHPRLGRSARASADPVRLGQEPTMAFPPTTIDHVHRDRSGRAWLENLIFGLFGPNGPLPLHLTEYARERLRNYHDRSVTRFADTFHHRLLSLFYRAWADAQPTVQRDRPQNDRFAVYVSSLIGLGQPSLFGRDGMDDDVKRYFAGRLVGQPANQEGLVAILQVVFGLPVEIDQFIGEWVALPPQYHLHLGASPETGGLGTTAIIGERVWSCQHKFRILFGPMGLDDYESLLPGGRALEMLIPVVRNVIGDELSWDVNLILAGPEVPPVILGSQGRLGWTAWMGERDPAVDADDLKLQVTIQ